MGLRPVYRPHPSPKSWKRCPGQISWATVAGKFQLTWSHEFNFSQQENSIFFAFTYPYSFDQIQAKITEIEAWSRQDESIYFHREIAGLSFEKRPVDLITISSKEGIGKEREELIPELFPYHEGKGELRPLKFEGKKYIFLSARVHPAETASSFVLNGILDCIFGKNRANKAHSKHLLKNFVFKIIPCLNPDGVSRGYYRLDTFSQNLNRFYIQPSLSQSSPIYTALEVIKQIHKASGLQFYIDLHAHPCKKGCFIFGNSLQGDAYLENVMFAKLISMNSLAFDFAECSFSQKLMACKDNNGLS